MMLSSIAQPTNALGAMLVMLAGIETLCIVVLFAKALLAIPVTI